MAMAEHIGCAMILTGYINKAQGLKSGYRGLGSIDFRAAARSVLVVGRLKEDPTVRVVAQDKNSLAPAAANTTGCPVSLKRRPSFSWQSSGCVPTLPALWPGSARPRRAWSP